MPPITASLWPGRLAVMAELHRPAWQQWRARQAPYDPPAVTQLDSAPVFAPYEQARLRFMRWLWERGRISL